MEILALSRAGTMIGMHPRFHDLLPASAIAFRRRDSFQVDRRRNTLDVFSRTLIDIAFSLSLSLINLLVISTRKKAIFKTTRTTLVLVDRLEV